MQGLQESLLGMRAERLASGHHSWLAVERSQCPGFVLEAAGAGTGHSDEQAQGTRPACALTEARVARQGHLVPWVEVGEPEIQAAKWPAAEVVEDPGTRAPTEGRGGLGRGAPCPNRQC